MMASEPDRNGGPAGGVDLAASDGAELEVVPLGPPAALGVVPRGRCPPPHPPRPLVRLC